MFFALQTERRDGHIFIPELLEKGVLNFVVRKGFAAEKFPSANFIFAENTLAALQKLAAHHRSQFYYPVIGITGSNGKTIVKEWLYQLLSPDYNIVRSPRSYNSQIGVPLSVWQMSKEHDFGIFEAGISQPGEMERLQKIIRPSIGVFTNIGEAHSENFKGLSEKITEKSKLFTEANTIIFPLDDNRIATVLFAGFPSHQFFTWGRNDMADVKIVSIEKNKGHTKIDLAYRSAQPGITIPFIDDASINNAITCASVLLFLGVPANVIAERMRSLHPVDMRLQLMHGINNCILVNDSYSFDITSFSVALDFLVQQQQEAQKTVIISDIPNVKTAELYEEVSHMLQSRKIQRVITIGEQWHKYQPTLTNKIQITEHYASTGSFIQHFSANHFHSEAILLKGARIFSFEKIVSLLQRKVHQTVMEINLSAITHNLNEYRKNVKKTTKIMAMVKAFAYGSGSTEVANLLQFHKVDSLAVAYADEGVELHKAGIRLPVMIMNVDEEAFETIIEHNLEPELFSLAIFKSFDTFLQRQGIQQYPVHLKLDTGMHRLGFGEKDLGALLSLLQQNQRIVVKSVFSHLAASEDPAEDEFTLRQAAQFEKCCELILHALGYNFIKHIANSAAILRLPSLQFDMVRLGIGLYGIESTAHLPSLQPAATLKTTVAQIRSVPAGETVGYNRWGKTTRDSVIATIRIGYADGFSRKLSNGVGRVYVGGNFAPVIGLVSMDMTMIDVTDIPNVREGDEVEIFGSHISVQEVAKACETIPYEILAGISQRVKRVYIEE